METERLSGPGRANGIDWQPDCRLIFDTDTQLNKEGVCQSRVGTEAGMEGRPKQLNNG